MTLIKTSTALPQSEDSLFDFIQKAAVIGTWEVDLKSNILTWSEETKNIHEVSSDYIPNVETSLSYYKEGYSRDTITKLFTDSIEKHESFDTELQIITAKGNEKWVRSIGQPIFENGECVKVQGLFQDIDEKTKNSKKLAFKEEQLRRTFDHAVVGMAILDLKGNWLKINKSLCDTLGYSREELMETPFVDITYPEDKKIGYKGVNDMVNGTINHFETEIRYISKKGDIVWTLVSSTLVKNDKGEPQHFVVQINDLTDIKKSSSKVEQLLETTENQNKRLLNFAHIVSHNLRSHYGNLDMLLDIMKMDMPETTKNEIFPLIKEAVNHLGETVENLNEVAAINVKNDIELEPINLLDIFNKAFKSISAQIIESKTKICMDIDADIYVKGIPAYLDSIILNFLTNAIKYKKADEPAKIEVYAFAKKNKIVLQIKDLSLIHI